MVELAAEAARSTLRRRMLALPPPVRAFMADHIPTLDELQLFIAST
jgi:hypothetical protein